MKKSKGASVRIFLQCCNIWRNSAFGGTRSMDCVTEVYARSVNKCLTSMIKVMLLCSDKVKTRIDWRHFYCGVNEVIFVSECELLHVLTDGYLYTRIKLYIFGAFYFPNIFYNSLTNKYNNDEKTSKQIKYLLCWCRNKNTNVHINNIFVFRCPLFCT